MDLFRYKQWNLVGKRGLYYLISIVVLAGCLVALFTRGLNWGIDFTGGSQYVYRFPKQIAKTHEAQVNIVAETRQALEKAGIVHAEVQVLGSDSLQIRTRALTNEAKEAQEKQLLQLLEKTFAQRFGQPELVQSALVGPVIGGELTRKAIWALLVGFALQLMYIGIRYTMPGQNGLRFGVTAVLALIHDVIVMLGATALIHVQVNSWFVASLLTVVGYSVNDSVIIFDRIRENLKNRRREPFDRVVNGSLLQTMARSVNTVLTTEFALVAIWLFGGRSLQGFAFTLVIGMLSGTYSSIFLASPLVVSWRIRDEKKLGLRTPDGRPLCVELALKAGKSTDASMALSEAGYTPEVRTVAGEPQAQPAPEAAAPEEAPAPEAGEATQTEKAEPAASKQPKRQKKSKPKRKPKRARRR